MAASRLPAFWNGVPARTSSPARRERRRELDGMKPLLCRVAASPYRPTGMAFWRGPVAQPERNAATGMVGLTGGAAQLSARWEQNVKRQGAAIADLLGQQVHLAAPSFQVDTHRRQRREGKACAVGISLTLISRNIFQDRQSALVNSAQLRRWRWSPGDKQRPRKLRLRQHL